ncbi:PDR/VanB family oxidoreductase [Nocardioides sp.]|uniref:PDR/VanB family oxidoreductase n=1 Tax=Nocardioides sp. TaxID=35761 RepID=UPI003D0C3E22
MTQATETLVSEFEADVRVSSVSPVADDVVEISFEAHNGSPLPPWTPGAHIDLLLSADTTRQYSLCGSPADPVRYQVAVLKAPQSRGGSLRVHELAAGDELRIRGPRNHFPMLASPRYVFIAGGIGITPMLPMIEAAEAAGATWELHYGGRSLASMAYLDTLAAYGDRVHLVPQDEKGILDLATILGTPAPQTLVYCCGPEPLLAAVESACTQWPPGALHLERFSAKPRQDEGEDTSFELVLQRSGLTVTVPPEQSVFEAMRAAGVPVLGSCLEGICGTCETGVIEGEVDHRDSVLDEDEQEENDAMMVCVSRCRSARLVLDA